MREARVLWACEEAQGDISGHSCSPFLVAAGHSCYISLLGTVPTLSYYIPGVGSQLYLPVTVAIRCYFVFAPRARLGAETVASVTE